MTKDFTVHRTWTEHEGCTKFYQFFLIFLTKDSNKAAAVTHYASLSNASAKGDRRPVVGGRQTVLSKEEYKKKRLEKTKDGYSDISSSGEFWSKADLVACFGARQTDKVVFEMFGTFTPDFTADELPSKDTDTEDLMVAKAPDVRPASWGTW